MHKFKIKYRIILSTVKTMHGRDIVYLIAGTYRKTNFSAKRNTESSRTHNNYIFVFVKNRFGKTRPQWWLVMGDFTTLNTGWPPVVHWTYFLFSKSGMQPARMAAKPVAPAPSTTDFSTSTRRKIAIAMVSSLHTRADHNLQIQKYWSGYKKLENSVKLIKILFF